jgi:hypothetical protein
MDKRKNNNLDIKKTTIKEITPSVLANVRGGKPSDPHPCDSNATCTGLCGASIPILISGIGC